MTVFQKIIKYFATALALFLAVGIIGGILSMFGLLGGFFGGDAATEDMKTYEVSSEIDTLEVNINAADFIIKQGEKFSVESNLRHLAVEDKDGVLTVKETKKFGNIGNMYKDASLVLYIPKDTAFKKAKIKTGAGRLTADYLFADKISLELGAGDVKINTLIASSSADIDGGAGRITISGGALHNLDLDMGVGQLNLTSALSGEDDFDLGVGESNITVIGNRDDYNLDIEKGIGNITVDGMSISGIREKSKSENSIEIDGGIGAVNLKFRETSEK